MEGIIKAATIDQVNISEDGTIDALAKIYLNAKALAAMCEKVGVDPALVSTTYIVYADDGIDTETVNLAEAAEAGIEVSAYNFIDIGTPVEGD